MLRELKVLELASVLAGPSVGQFFAELGADVIKVENLPGGGDVTRSWKLPGEQTDDRSAYFCCTNWGKKSVAIDLTKAEGRELVWRLAKSSDIVIVSYKPGDAKLLGVDYQTLIDHNPRLIYGEITGYGKGSAKVGYDAVIQAESGFMFMNGEPGGRSLKMPVALMDILAGHQLKEGLLVALIERAKTDKGKLVSVSIIESAIASLANQASNWLIAGQSPQKKGSIHPNIAPYGEVFSTKDGNEILIAVGNDRQFRDLCQVLELNDLAIKEDFKTNALRVTNRNKLSADLQERFSVLDSSELVEQLHVSKIPAGHIKSVDQVLGGDAAKELMMDAHHLRGIRTFVSDKSASLGPPPHLGEHTREILINRLNLDETTVASLIRTDVIR